MPKRGKGRSKADRRAEMTPEECYLDVKDFWLRLAPDRRTELLRVPIRQLILGELLACLQRMPTSEALPLLGMELQRAEWKSSMACGIWFVSHSLCQGLVQLHPADHPQP